MVPSEPHPILMSVRWQLGAWRLPGPGVARVAPRVDAAAHLV